MSQYASFASYYDALTLNVDYEKRADYLCELLRREAQEPGLTLDLACGTGSLTLALAKRGIDVYGIDGSPDMLSIAQQKAAELGYPLLFLCQQMQRIDLYGTVNTVVCALDSLNHLTEEADVQATFQRVSLFLEPGGYFIFDVNTVYKHREILADHTFVYDTEDVYCVWQNRYDPVDGKELVEISLDFFERDGAVYYKSSEQFYERAYPTSQLCRMLEEAGLQPVHIFDDMRFEAPINDSQRVVVVAKKPGQA